MSDKKEMIVINNAGHTPFLDKPEQFCEAVKTFLSECENEYLVQTYHDYFERTNQNLYKIKTKMY